MMMRMRMKMRNEDEGDAKEWTQTSNAMYLTYLYPDFQNKEVQNERRAKNAISNALLRVLILTYHNEYTHVLNKITWVS